MKGSFLWIFASSILFLGCQTVPEGEAPALKVLSYNIHHGEGVDGVLDLDRIARLIVESGADLVALQEVDREVARTGKVDQLGVLSAKTGTNGAFAKFMDFEGGEYGLAILSRFPIEEAWPIGLPPGKHEPRSALAVRVVPPGRSALVFVCLHFDWLKDDENRWAQARALLAALDGIEEPVILAGDFNDLPESRTLDVLRERFVNVGKPELARATFSAQDPVREIDFVMFRPAGEYEGSARTLDERVASDHLPVLAELR